MDELDILLVDVIRNFLVDPFAPIVELTVVVNVSWPLQLQVFFKFFSFNVKTLQYVAQIKKDLVIQCRLEAFNDLDVVIEVLTFKRYFSQLSVHLFQFRYSVDNVASVIYLH